MRCFIGIDLSSPAIKEIKRLQNIIEPHFTGKVTESKNLHLTLKFLGEINNVTLKKVKKKTIFNQISTP
jgi:2'-5' RNA ligase